MPCYRITSQLSVTARRSLGLTRVISLQNFIHSISLLCCWQIKKRSQASFRYHPWGKRVTKAFKVFYSSRVKPEKAQNLGNPGVRTFFNECPEPRSTNDLDLFLRPELIIQSAKLKPLAEAISRLGYQVVAEAEKYQFTKPGPGYIYHSSRGSSCAIRE